MKRIVVSFFLFLLIPSAYADLLVLTADNITATRGVANPLNATGRFDGVLATLGQWQSTNDVATMTISNFTATGTLLNVMYAIRMNTSGNWSNDNLAVQYSNDSGTTWFTSNASMQPNSTLQVYGNYTVNINSIAALNSMQVRLVYNKNTAVDVIISSIDGVEVYVSYAPPPNITLNAPANATWLGTRNVSFNFTPVSLISFQNCSLWINATLNTTNQTPIANGTPNYINITVGDGDYLWNITCYDNASFSGTANSSFLLHVSTKGSTVSLVSPANNNISTTNVVNFTYNVTDFAPIMNCSLIINGSINMTNSSITRSANQSFLAPLANGNYTWSVNCTDQAGFTNSSVVRNITVRAPLPPKISNLTAVEIVLNPGSTQWVDCNFTATDTNGVSEITGANATFFLAPNTSDSPLNNLSYYRNISCTNVSQNTTSINYTCSVQMLYYARNGSWTCNATAISLGGIDSKSVNFTVDPLFALNITNPVMDFGDVPIGSISSNVSESIINLGNQPINVSVQGYGRVIGDGLAFQCAVGNVSVQYIHFSKDIAASYTQKINLSSSAIDMGIVIPPQVNATTMMNITYWQTMIPNGSYTDLCNGSIVFNVE